MAADENRPGGWCYDSLFALKSETVSWDDSEKIVGVVDDEVFSLPAVQAHLQGDTAADKADALGKALDDAIRGLIAQDEAEKRTDPNSTRASQPHALAAAVVLRRLELVPESFLKSVDDDPEFREPLAELPITKRQDAIRRHAWGVVFRNRQGEVIGDVADLLNPPRKRRSRSVGRPPNPFYKPPDPEELDKGFWWRPSTKHYVETLAAREGLALYAGADGLSDVGEPLHRRLATLFLTSTLRDDRLLEDLPERVELAKAVAETFETLSPTYIGSMLRGLAAEREVPDARLEVQLAEIAADNTTPRRKADSRRRKAFLSERLAALAAALAEEDCATQIISAHNDDDVDQALDALRERGFDKDIRVHCLHPVQDEATGYLAQTALSEADLFEQKVPGEEDGRTWVGHLAGVLRDHRALFTGTDIRSPGLVAALVETRDTKLPRFAVLIPPEPRPSPPPERPPEEREAIVEAWPLYWRALYLRAAGARYLDLGVVPIWVDFPYQVPALLNEIRLCLKSDVYYHFADRYDAWWEAFAPAFGAVAATARVPGIPDQTGWQAAWHRALLKLRTAAERHVTETRGLGAEFLLFEAWIRDPTHRELFLWASSDHVLRSETAPRVSLRDKGGVLQEAFREGDTKWGTGSRPPWGYAIALPIVLEASPYHGLPIGVLRVMSTESAGELRRIERNPLALHIEASLGNAIQELFSAYYEPVERLLASAASSRRR